MMSFEKNWREKTSSRLDEHWDIIIIGGGITGAGILKEATRCGYSALLLEQHDFSSGTSSRSSKLVHGGFRYLKNGQFKLTMDSVKEREKLLREGEGLIHPLKFLFANKSGDSTPGYMFGLGLFIYGLMAGKWQHDHFSPEEMRNQCQMLNIPGLVGGYRYYDAQTDDARLTLRVIQEAVRAGGYALNYTRAANLLTTRDNRVCGVLVEDLSPVKRPPREVFSKIVINAAGPWVDVLRAQIFRPPCIRPLRGSHLAFSQKVLPLNCAVSMLHPRDGRSVFIFPWESLTIVGTTDVDTHGKLAKEPHISQLEADYLFQLVNFTFPNEKLMEEDVISTWSGIRPVIGTGKVDPSKESREHVIWEENGLLTITGGKLTTFRIMAQQAIRQAQKIIGSGNPTTGYSPILDPISQADKLSIDSLTPPQIIRLFGRYGYDALRIIDDSSSEDITVVDGTDYLWAEITWAIKKEAVVHLDDLLLRRARIGLLTKDGGASLLPRIKQIFQKERGWDDLRWENEKENYLTLRKEAYGL